MAEIKLFLLSSLENEVNINQFFPSDYNDQETLAELLKVSKHFKKCGDGCLQTKDFIYYYKTFISLVKMDQNLFLLFLCTNSYSEKNIDSLCEEIFQILDDDPIEDMKLKKSAKSEINTVFLKYKNLNGEIKKNLFGIDIKIPKKPNNINEISDDRSYISCSKVYNNKRGDPRLYSYIIRKQSSENDSSLFSDSNAFKTCSFDDSGLTVVKRFNDNITNENIEKWKRVKKHYLIFSLILSIMTYFLFPLLLRLLFN